MAIATAESKGLAESLVFLTQRLHPKRGVLRTFGIKQHAAMALHILATQQTMIVGEIRKILGILPAAMTRVIHELEERDRPLVKRTINDEDNRRFDVELTAAGRQMEEQLRALETNHLEALIQKAEIDQDELRIFEQTLQKLISAFRNGAAKQEANNQRS